VNTAINVGASHHVSPVARYTHRTHTPIELMSWHLTQQVFLPRDAMLARYLLFSFVPLAQLVSLKIAIVSVHAIT